ncbi:hypothetical protein FHR95_003325 [Halomonas fontilapidosi]|uniref:Uncharacterized protein n=1 Tax=Halomonas fontilapidosi TaxID=616675 RepID=A0A7W5H0W9_9GAMM|nr:hypothetical protein [Halomonas fontilapidosi]MBB3185732.1 hypothetical protein [Halomonas fontilapidosi]
MNDADLAALTSSDLDIVSETKDNVRLLARAWGGEPRFAGMDDHTPNIAVIDLERPGWSPDGSHLIVDVMGDVYGATAHQLITWSEMIEITLENGQTVCLRVVVPEMLLWTRIANLYMRRMGPIAVQRELRRTKVLCQIVSEHLENLAQETMVDPSLRRIALKHASLVYQWIAKQNCTRKVLARHPELIDPYLSAVPRTPFWPTDLLEHGLPNWQNWLIARVESIIRHQGNRRGEKEMSMSSF